MTRKALEPYKGVYKQKNEALLEEKVSADNESSPAAEVQEKSDSVANVKPE